MYDYLKGNITNKEFSSYRGTTLTVEVNSVGYLVMTTKRTLGNLQGKEAKIFVSLVHKEDSMTFFGFLTREERDVFNILQSVSGVGAKSALQLLDEFSIAELINVVAGENAKELSRTKGIGSKMAQKIIIELKDKILNWAENVPQSIEAVKVNDIDTSIIEEAQTIMLSLGYSLTEAREAINNTISNNKNLKTAEDILKSALAYLATMV